MHAGVKIAVERSKMGGLRHAAVVAAVAMTFGPLSARASDVPAPAAADTTEQNSSTLPEIVVTAQRRETKLKDTPASVEAFTADRLDAQGIRGIDDLTRVSPGVMFVRQGTSASANYNDENSDIAIRGIDSNAGAATTGLYIDDTPIQTRHLQFGTVTAFPALFDLERVEVLRGPQGTLFGSGAEGGAIRFIQPEPSVTTSTAYARAEVATTQSGAPSYEGGAAFGAPLTQGKIGYRISASYRYDGGYVNRDSYNIVGATAPISTATPFTLQDTGTTESNSNWQKTETFRAAMKFQVSSDTSITPSVYYQRLHINDSSVFWAALSNPGSSDFRSGNAQPNSSTDPFWLWSVKVDSDLGWAHASSNTSYFDRNQSARTDYTQWVNTVFLGAFSGVPGPVRTTATFQDIQHNFTEEVKLQSPGSNTALNWVTGLFFSHQYENTPETFAVSGDPAYNPFANPYPNGNDFVQSPYATTDRQIALFGQVDLEILPKVKATVGLRVANIRTEGNGYFAGALVGPGNPPPSVITAGAITETPVTPKFGLSYQPDKDDLFYATIAKGYRVGGINSQVGGLCSSSLTGLGLSAAPSSFKSDSLWSFEVGSKNTLLDHRLQIDSSVYYIDWKDIQHNIYLSCGLQFAANLGKATSKGFDVSAHFRATQSLTLGLDVGYTDAYYNNTVYAGAPGAGAPPIVTAGNVLSTTPWNANLAADYIFPSLGQYDPYLHVDYQFTNGQRGLAPIQDSNNAFITVADTSTPPVVATRVMALRAGARWDQFDASLFVNNVLNQAPVLFQSRDYIPSQLFFQRTLRPRTIGLTGTYRF